MTVCHDVNGRLGMSPADTGRPGVASHQCHLRDRCGHLGINVVHRPQAGLAYSTINVV